MRRVFWMSLGAAAGYYAARKGAVVVDEARERGLVGNVTLVAGSASKAAAAAARASVAVGEAVGSRARSRASSPGATETARPTPLTSPSTPDSREVRP